MKTDSKTKLPLIRKRLVNNHSSRSIIQPMALDPPSRQSVVSRSADVLTVKNEDLFRTKTSFDFRSGSIDTYPGPVGLPAKIDFYDSYKNLPKYSQKNKFQGLTVSPSLAYLEYVEKAKLKPLPIGVVRRKGKPEDFNLESMRIGDSYAEAFSKGLKFVKRVERLNLQSNRLTEKGSLNILKNLDSSNLRVINLADNRIGSNSVKILVDILQDYKSSIKYLNLESTSLSSSDVILLCSALEYNRSISKLSLAKNNISDKAAQALGTMIERNNKIKILDLQWNKIRASGAVAFFFGLKKNNTIQQLDLSWNSMGREDSIEIAQSMSDALMSNTKLVHLDISYNNFTLEECKIIGEGLMNNHTLLGLHVDGNSCVVDSRGFIKPTSSGLKGDTGHYYRRIIDSPKYIHHNNIVRNCWVCEKWIEFQFHHTTEELEPLFIHLECDHYEPEMLYKTSGNLYEITRVVPPGPCKFFFSTLSSCHTSNSYSIIELAHPLQQEVSYWDGDSSQAYAVRINTHIIQGRHCDIRDPFPSQPRTPKNRYIPPEGAPERISWSIPISLFKDYRFDSEVFSI
jgi:Ran GTPase-activating protein (RanGAP) involved in mRNA processing and transport